MSIRHLAFSVLSLFSSASACTFSLAEDSPAFKAAEIPLTLTSFGATRLGDKVYIYGGHTGDAHSYSDKEQSNQLLCLDLSKPQEPWQVISESTRLQGLAIVAYNGKVIRIGGFTALNALGEEHKLKSSNEVSAYDVGTGKWEELPSLPEARSSHDAILVGSKVYVVGGWQLDGGSNDSQWHDTAYVMDLAAEKLEWKPIAKPPFQRRALSLVAYGDSIAAIGGMEAEGKITKDTVIYSPAEDKWQDGPDLVGEGRMTGFGTAAIAVNGTVLVSTIDGALQQLKLGDSEWKACGKTQDARFFHELIALDSNRVLVLGGANMEHGKFQNIEVINVSK